MPRPAKQAARCALLSFTPTRCSIFSSVRLPSRSKRNGTAVLARHIAHQAMAVAQLFWVGRRAVLFEVVRRCAGNQRRVAEAPCHQRRAVEWTAADDAIHVVA